MENEFLDNANKSESTNRISTRPSKNVFGRSASRAKSRNRMRSSTRYSRYPSKNRNSAEENPKQELLLIRASVSFIIVVVAFAVAKFDTPQTSAIRQKLKVAITESVSFSEAKEYGEKGMEMLYTFKEEQTEKIDSMVEDEILLPVDSQTIN